MWRQALEAGLDEFIVATEAEFVNVLAAIDSKPAGPLVSLAGQSARSGLLAPSGLRIIPSEALPEKLGIDFGRYDLFAIGIDDW